MLSGRGFESFESPVSTNFGPVDNVWKVSERCRVDLQESLAKEVSGGIAPRAGVQAYVRSRPEGSRRLLE